MRRSAACGFTIWFMGVPGVGKSTLAQALHLSLRERLVEVIDGDAFRRDVSPELGFSESDRITNMRRIGYVARLLSRNGVAVIVASIAPFARIRDEIRASHEAAFVEVFLDCTFAELVRRDSKGLYARALRGELTGLSGMSDPFEPPASPDLHIRTDRTDPDAAIQQVHTLLHARGLVRRPASRGAGADRALDRGQQTQS
jgi:adenylyl-sulfate kinase